MLATIHRLWLRSAIDVDPDVVYFRDTDLSAGTTSHLQALSRISGVLGTSDPVGELTPGQRASLADFLDGEPERRQVSRYAWEIDGSRIDFAPVTAAGDREPDWRRVG